MPSVWPGKWTPLAHSKESNQSVDAQESAQYQVWPGKWTPLATLKSTPGFWQKWVSTPSFLLELTTGKRAISGDYSYILTTENVLK
jgi:hypothetical protein